MKQKGKLNMKTIASPEVVSWVNSVSEIVGKQVSVWAMRLSKFDALDDVNKVHICTADEPSCHWFLTFKPRGSKCPCTVSIIITWNQLGQPVLFAGPRMNVEMVPVSEDATADAFVAIKEVSDILKKSGWNF